MRGAVLKLFNLCILSVDLSAVPIICGSYCTVEQLQLQAGWVIPELPVLRASVYDYQREHPITGQKGITLYSVFGFTADKHCDME